MLTAGTKVLLLACFGAVVEISQTKSALKSSAGRTVQRVVNGWTIPFAFMGNLNTFSYYNVVQSPPSHTGSVVEARRSMYQFPHRVSILPLEAQFTVLPRKLDVNSIHLMDL